jgi:hypothetical protein
MVFDVPYVFYCCDIVDALQYMDSNDEFKLYLSPKECYIQGFYADYAGLCEIVLTPLYFDENFVGEVTITNTEQFEKYTICEIFENKITFDNIVTRNIEFNSEIDTLKTKKPGNSFLIEFPEKISNHIDEYQKITFSYNDIDQSDELEIQFGQDFKAKLDTIIAEIEDDNIKTSFSSTLFLYILEKINKKQIIKLYVSNDFPLCVEIPGKNMIYYYLAPSE